MCANLDRIDSFSPFYLLLLYYRHVLREEAPGQHHKFYEDDTVAKIAMFFDPQFEGVFKERGGGGGQGDNESNPIHNSE